MKDGRWKRVPGFGCGLLFLIVVGVFGVLTWYSGQINHEYKEVKDSEAALIAATEAEEDFTPPAGGIPAPDRIEIFLAVREELGPWRGKLATAVSKLASDRERQRAGGPRDVARMINTGSDLMPIFAGFWTARNEILLARGMGPGEYAYIYRLVFNTWLNFGRTPLPETKYPHTTLDSALAAYGDRFEATFSVDVDPVELIFMKDKK